MKTRLLIIGIITSFFSLSTAVAETKIDFWTTETQSDRMKTIQLILNTFEALNEGIKVNLVGVDENDVPKQMAAASAAGNLPELVEAGSELSVAFGNEGLLDVAAATKTIKSIGESKFFSGALKLVSTAKGNQYYGIPYHGWVQGIWYRADWFKKAGLKPPNTWKNILTAAKYFNKPAKNQYGILIGTKADSYAEQVFTQLAISNGAREFDGAGKLVFNSKAMLETLDFYKQLQKYSPPGPQTWRARDYYLQGKLAMFFYSTYIMDDLALAENASNSLTNENFPSLSNLQFDPNLVSNTKMAPIITNKQPSNYGVIVALNLVKEADKAKAEAARKLVRYMFEESAYVTFLHMAPGGMNPTIKSVAKSKAFLNDPRGLFKRYGQQKLANIISGLNSIQKFEIVDGKTFPKSGEIFAKQIIPRMIYSTLFEGVSSQDALNWAEKKMIKVIEE